MELWESPMNNIRLYLTGDLTKSVFGMSLEDFINDVHPKLELLDTLLTHYPPFCYTFNSVKVYVTLTVYIDTKCKME